MKKFDLGQIVATPAALEAIENAGQDPAFFLNKHAAGDWGQLDNDDAALNDEALVSGERLLSAYKTLRGQTIWIITEAVSDGKRECSTLLTPNDY